MAAATCFTYAQAPKYLELAFPLDAESTDIVTLQKPKKGYVYRFTDSGELVVFVHRGTWRRYPQYVAQHKAGVKLEPVGAWYGARIEGEMDVELPPQGPYRTVAGRRWNEETGEIDNVIFTGTLTDWQRRNQDILQMMEGVVRVSLHSRIPAGEITIRES